MIYFDNAATTKVSESVISAMVDLLRNKYFNPSSLYDLGIEVEKLLDESRKTVAGFLGVDAKNLFFTSCGTEGNNLAIFSNLTGRDDEEFVTSDIEHSSVYKTYKHIGGSRKVHFVNIGDDFKVDDIIDKVNNKTALVSIMQVNNETGRILPIEEIGQRIKEKNPRTLFHVDGIQGYGKIRLDLNKAKVDFYTASGHKIHASKGIGLLYARHPERIRPLMYGGSQEGGVSPGTENTAGIVGFKVASQEAFNNLEENYKRLYELKKYLMESIEEKISDVYFNSGLEGYSPYITNVCFKGIKSEVLLHSLEADGIYISTGSACNKNAKSRIIESIKTPEEYADGCIRISFTDYSSKQEVDEFIDRLVFHVENIRKVMGRS
ncbi:MAG: cysteine desulfurase family protein [Finegoldia sp.]|nr:cysteine desulfurase family protein [Finegoldia sp.]